MRKEFRDLADPETARETMRSLDVDPGTERVPLDAADGRVLAERVDADLDVPGFDRSKLDGYALRARDTFGASETDPASMTLVGRVDAGERPAVEVGVGEVVEVATGAVMPPGADAMVPVERTDRPDGGVDDDRGDVEDEAVVHVRTAVAPGENVALAGADLAAGERALGPGTRLTSREIGLLSALGTEAVPVRARPAVGVISTGDELVPPGEPLDHDHGQIYDVNAAAIAAAVREAGGDPTVYPHVGDDPQAMEHVVREAASECDLVLTSGATSAGQADLLHRVVAEEGELLLHGVAVKPGKPMLVGRVPGVDPDDDLAAYVGLPGYPVSAMTIFRTFVAPLVRDAAGLPEPATATVAGRLVRRERYAEGRLRYVPVGLVEDGAGERLVYPVDKGSGATTSLSEADGVVEMPADTAVLDAGERVTVQLFSPDVRPPSLLGVGEDDPLLSRALDRLDAPRYLSRGTRPGRRWLRDDVADVAVLAGPHDDPEDATLVGSWTREWGLVVPAGNPDDVTGLADLVDRDLSFVNRPTESGLRTSLANALADLAGERGTDRRDLVAAIDGFELTARAHESPARRVARGDRDAGIGLRATADALDLGFVSLGDQAVTVYAAERRAEKLGVRAFEQALDESDLAGLAGYD